MLSVQIAELKLNSCTFFKFFSHYRLLHCMLWKTARMLKGLDLKLWVIIKVSKRDLTLRIPHQFLKARSTVLFELITMEPLLVELLTE